MTNFNLKL